MRKSRISVLIMLALILTISTINLAYTTIPTVPIGQTLQTTPYESNPTAGTSSGITVTNPIGNAYDGLLDTQCNFQYGQADGYVELTTFDAPGVTFTIGWVDFKVSYKAMGLGVYDERYRIVYQVGSSSWQILLDWVSGTDAQFDRDGLQANRPWTNRPEPNDGVWTWADIGNIKFRVETDLVTSNHAMTFTLYEVWLSVYPQPFPPAGVSLQPSTINLAPGTKFFTDVYATGMTNLWGYQTGVFFDTNLLTPLEYYSYYPFTSESPSVISDFTYLSVSDIDDTIYVDGFDNARTGWLKLGASPYLGGVDYPINYVDSGRNLTIRPDGNGYFKGPTVTIRPEADATYSTWSIYPAAPTTHWDKVDESGVFDDTDYIYATADGSQDSFAMSNTAAAGTIWGVKLTIVARNTASGSDESITPMLVIGGTRYNGTTYRVTPTSYGFFTHTWAENPATLSAWTWTDINNLEAGVRSVQVGAWTGELRITQLYVEVNPDWSGDYTAWDDPGAASDGDSTYVSVSCDSHFESSTLSNPAHVGTIMNVRLHVVARNSDISDEAIRGLLVIGGVDYYRSSFTPELFYDDYVSEFRVNPATGSAWAWSEIDALEAGVQSVQAGTTVPPWRGELRVTQIWVEVVYDVVGDEIGNFSFEDLVPGELGGNVAVEMKAGQNLEELGPNDGTGLGPTGDDSMTVWVYDGTVWASAGVLIPANISMPWISLDVSSILDTPAKINNAKVYLVKQTTARPDSIKVDAVRLRKTGWNRVGASPYVGASDYPASFMAGANAAVLRPDGNGIYQGSRLIRPDGFGTYGSLTLRPDADGSNLQWSPFPAAPTTHYDKVDETTAGGNGDTDYVYAPNKDLAESFDLPDVTPSPSWTPSGVRLTVVAKHSTGGESLDLVLWIGATPYVGTNVAPPLSYTTYQYTWATNPATASAWTWSDINGLEAGFVTKAVGGWSGTAYVTQLYIEVLNPAPDWTGDYTDWDDIVADATTLVTASSNNLNESSTLADPSPAAWSVSSVRLTIRARNTAASDERIIPMLVIGGNGYQGESFRPTTSWFNYQYAWLKNPATGSAWTWSDINNLEAGVRSLQVGGAWSGVLQVTQLYVEINPDWIGSYADWDEATQDGDTTKVQTNANGNNETSTLSDPAHVGTIVGVRLSVVAKKQLGGSDEQLRLMIVTGGKGYNGSLTPLTTAYELYQHTWIVNPATASAWTWSEIDALEAGVRSQQIGSSFDGYLYVTQLFVEVLTDAPNGVVGNLLFNDMICENYGKKIEIQMYMKGDGDDSVEVWLYNGASYTLADTLTPTASWGWVTGTVDVGMFLLDTKAKINGTQAFLVKKTSSAAGLIEVDHLRLKVYTGYVRIAYSSYMGDPTGFSGNTTLARIYFEVDGGAYGSTPLDIAISVLSDTGGSPIAHSVTDGLFSNGIRDVAVTTVQCKGTLAYNATLGTNYHRHVNVTVYNDGGIAETFYVGLFWNDTNLIGTQTISSLAVATSTNTSFTWTTVVPQYGNVTLTAKASKLPGEIDTADNALTQVEEIKVTVAGDVNADQTVNILDILKVKYHWYPGPPVGTGGYNVNVDINDDYAINILDILIVKANWGISW